MKVLYEPPPTAEEINELKKDEVNRLRAYIKAEETKMNDALRLNDEKRVQINQLMDRLQKTKKHNLMLKKCIVLEDLKRKRRSWL